VERRARFLQRSAPELHEGDVLRVRLDLTAGHPGIEGAGAAANGQLRDLPAQRLVGPCPDVEVGEARLGELDRSRRQRDDDPLPGLARAEVARADGRVRDALRPSSPDWGWCCAVSA